MNVQQIIITSICLIASIIIISIVDMKWMRSIFKEDISSRELSNVMVWLFILAGAMITIIIVDILLKKCVGTLAILIYPIYITRYLIHAIRLKVFKKNELAKQ